MDHGRLHLTAGWHRARGAGLVDTASCANAPECVAPGESAKARYWIARGLSDAVPPIAFMLWLHGLLFAVTTLLADLPQSMWIERGLVVLGWVRGVGTLLGLAWLLARIARTLEALLQSFATRTRAPRSDSAVAG